MNLLSASSLHRIDLCAASAVLPRGARDTPANERGKVIHAFLCSLGVGKSRDEALANVPEEYRAICAELPDPGPGRVEVAYAYDAETGKVRELGQNIDRQYGKLGRTEIPGSDDHEAMEGGVLVVTDYKTGHTEVPPARDNLQLHFLALCATKVIGATKARVRLRHIHEDGGWHDDVHEFDAFDLAAVADRISRLWTRVQIAQLEVRDGKQPYTHEGAHCTFCPSKTACPAKVAWLVRLGAPQGIAQRFDALLTGATARQAYEVYQRAEEVMQDIRGKLYAWARENPIDLDGGKVFGLTTMERESVDGAIVHRVLAEKFGEAVADAAVELSSSKAAIERALKAGAPKGSLAAYKRDAMKAIGDADGLQVKVTETIREYEKETDDAAKVA